MNLLRDLKTHIQFNFIIVLTGLVLSSCLPQQIRSFNTNLNDNLQSNVDAPTTEETTPVLLAQKVNFFQLGTQQESSTLSINSDYNDSFLLRGNGLNDFLKQKTNPFGTNYCLVTKFNQTVGNDAKEIFIASARVKSFLNYSSNTNEYYLQISPNNEDINSSDCITNEILAVISNKFGSTNFSLKASGVCPSCTTNISSQEIFIYSNSAVEQTDIDIRHLRLALRTTSSNQNSEVVSCSNNTNCETLGYNCCLEGQCVNHGEVKEGVDKNSDNFIIAYQKVLARPELIINYQDVFYICPTMVATNPDNNPEDTNFDPVQNAAIRLETLEELYNCTNPLLDEYSVCTIKYENSKELIDNGGHTFAAQVDDLTFKTINPSISFNNIKEISYGGIILFKEGFTSSNNISLSPADGSISSGSNDNFLNSQSVLINKSLPSTAINDTVKIKYTIDGTCEKLGSTLAKCTKSYIQGQSTNPARPSDHDTGKTFKLPSYANLSFNLFVEVDGIRIAQDASTWSVSGQNVVFANSYQIFNNQEIKISYFVTSNVDLLIKSKNEAQSKINQYCACDPSVSCSLRPVLDTIGGIEKVVDYSCSYPENNTTSTPLRETVYISSKSVAHRFFDINGVHYKSDNLSEAQVQEGEHFFYEGNNEFKPNNINSYIGFNEIYGTFNLSSTSAIPATEIDVVKGRNYDLWTESGVFSSCLNCGSDYYTSLVKTFPTEFSHKGSGYLPSLSESRRILNQSKFPADDMLFGRACFVPATMIPWTHVANDDVNLQRRNRLQAQHFLFANGYNKDWYGFDYGSVIGSFDGVHWFSVGNARRIQAKSNKLYLAVNGYYADVTNNNSYQITIQETVAVLFNGVVVDPDNESILFHDPNAVISTDLNSFGAQCQRFHLCETDNDCLTRLGYDYICAEVAGQKSSWPIFDKFAKEQSGSTEVSLLSLSGGSNGFPKRCVYRGKGAPCEVNSHTLNSASDSYSKSIDVALNVCSSNNYCEELTESKFNTKISRYANSPKNQNLKTFIPERSDTFGLTARILGRPYNFLGDEATPLEVQTQLNSTGVKSLCIPGKDPKSATDIESLNNNVNTRGVDNILNIGKTFNLSDLDDDYFTACPAIDNDKNSGNSYTYLNDDTLDSSIHRTKTVSQNMSTNSLAILNLLEVDLDIFNDDDSSGEVTKMGYTQNSCLRAPGASCYTDLDCSPNHFISSKISAINNFLTFSEAEQNFWKEDLVCANAQNRKLSNSTFDTPEYDLRTHKCCREIGKKFTFFSQKHKNDSIDYIDPNTRELRVPGIDLNISSAKRYSRVHTIYDLVTNSPTEYPAPLVPAVVPIAFRMTENNFKLRQYETIHQHNARMCCSGHWVRKFASGENGNGGGHNFGPSKQQNINNVEIFKTLNWNENLTPEVGDIVANPNPFVCNSNDAQTRYCEMRNISEDSERDNAMLSWFGKFELLGIPQVLIENSNHVYMPLSVDQLTPGSKVAFEGFFASDKQWDVKMTPSSLENSLLETNLSEVSGLPETSPIELYSAGNSEHFDLGGSLGLKKVFEENEFNCCIPTGIEITDASVDSNDCCTGLLSDFNGPRRCCLEDYTDVSVYTNRYVSSEGVKFQGNEISENDIDPLTGYIKKEVVLQMASSMCCSGQAAFGVAISDLFIPLDNGNSADPNFKSRRWIDNNVLDTLNGTLDTFREGQKWNNHVYCVPGGSSSSSNSSGSAVSQ